MLLGVIGSGHRANRRKSAIDVVEAIAIKVLEKEKEVLLQVLLVVVVAWRGLISDHMIQALTLLDVDDVGGGG